MDRWTKTSDTHGPDLRPVWDHCGLCRKPIWAEDPQTEPGYHDECYAEQLAATKVLLEDIRQEEEEDDYDPDLDGVGLGVLITSPYDSPY